MAKKSMGPKVPEHYECANPSCRRTLQTRYYMMDRVGNAVPEEVHQVFAPNLPLFTLMCTCGHYTVVKPWRENVESK